MLIVLGAGAVIQLTTTTFSSFSQGCALASLYGQVATLKMYNFIYGKRIFPISLLVYIALSIIYLIVSCTCLKKKRMDFDLSGQP